MVLFGAMVELLVWVEVGVLAVVDAASGTWSSVQALHEAWTGAVVVDALPVSPCVPDVPTQMPVWL